MATYGIHIPLMDLLYADPYRIVSERVQTAAYIGFHQTGDVKCHHLACTQENVDWQIWVEHGARPLPRKLVITYKKLPGQPQYMATFRRWDLAPRLPSSQFVFRPPAGAQKIDVAPLTKGTKQAPPGAEGAEPASPGAR